MDQRSDCYRLVLYQSGDGAEGSLFPLDAGAFTPPVFTFRLPRDQELPRLAPGEVVRLDRNRSDGSATVHAGNVEIPIAKPLKQGAGRGRGRIFAERGSVLAHPAAIGWDTSWRHVLALPPPPWLSGNAGRNVTCEQGGARRRCYWPLLPSWHSAGASACSRSSISAEVGRW